MNFKLDNVTNLTTARWAAAEGFSYISFNFDKESSSYIQPMQVVEICKWINGPLFVGSFGSQDSSAIRDIYELLPIHCIEIDLASAKKMLPDFEIPCILRIDVQDFTESLEFQKHFDNIIAFTVSNQVASLPGFRLEKSFLQQNFNAASIHPLLPFGVNFNSENETEPGIVDYEKMENALEKWTKVL